MLSFVRERDFLKRSIILHFAVDQKQPWFGLMFHEAKLIINIHARQHAKVWTVIGFLILCAVTFITLRFLTCIRCLGMEHGVGIGDKLQLPVQCGQKRTRQNHVALSGSLNHNFVHCSSDVKSPQRCIKKNLSRRLHCLIDKIKDNVEKLTLEKQTGSPCGLISLPLWVPSLWEDSSRYSWWKLSHLHNKLNSTGGWRLIVQRAACRHRVTRNDDCFERPHFDALGRILQRIVSLSHNEDICRTVRPKPENDLCQVLRTRQHGEHETSLVKGVVHKANQVAATAMFVLVSAAQ